jgi:sigma-B regulation protein RsbU (phosphoserine phosphatase)
VSYLKILKGANAGKFIPLESDRVVFGRHPSCHIVLEDGAVSRQHAQIVESHGSFYIEDLRSRNGTQVNDKDVLQATLMQNGDMVRVCEYEYRFHDLSSGEIPDDTEMVKDSSRFNRSGSSVHKGPAAQTKEIGEDSQDRSSIISRIDVRSGSGVRLSVKPEAKLRAILEIGQALSRVLDVDEVLPSILEALFQIYPQADQGFVLLAEAGGEKPVLRAHKNRRPDDDSMSISQTIVNQAMRTGEALLSRDATEDSRFVSSESLAGLRIRSMMCAPLVTQSGDRLGVIQVTTFDLRSHFTENDLDLLVNVATQCTLAVENATLHQSMLQQHDMQCELEFAMQVQLGFLPNKRPQQPEYEFSDFYEAAQHVGGDYFDYVELSDGRVAVCVADVAGKGVPAALLMARLYSAARYHLLTKSTVAEAMSGLNAEIATSGLGHRFITCLLTVIDPKEHHLTLASAGHLPPVRRSLSGEITLVEGNDMGLPLGIIPDQEFVQTVIPIETGDTWVLYTDGVTEAMTQERELYGTKRLVKFIESGPLDVDGLVKGIVDDIAAFAGESAQSDDLCMVAFQRTP